jgi:ribulose-5-phosphate 4-epimerase/fuculose-1-phosphate aldolase
MLAKEDIQNQREDLAAAYRLAAQFSFNEGIDNHITVKVPRYHDQFLLIPYGQHWAEATANSLLRVNNRGEQLEGEGFVEPSAFHIHNSIHTARPDASCVIHCHPPHPLALCMIEDGRLAYADQNACRFFGKVAYDDDYPGGAFDSEEGHRIAKMLSNKNILFMANHGITVVGNSIAHAWDQLYYLNRACEAQVLAMSTGSPLRNLPEHIVQKVVDQIDAQESGVAANYHRHFAALKRLLERDNSDYKT